MKRYIRSSADIPLDIGDKVTVIESKIGYANYEAYYVGDMVNNYGIHLARVKTDTGRVEEVPYSRVMKSGYEDLKKMTRDDVVSYDFIRSLQGGDAVWCREQRASRVDRDPSIENVVGYSASIRCYGNNNYRVVIIQYISKHYTETRDVTDENVTIHSSMIDEALEILKAADEVIVDYRGHQRIFR